MNYFKPPSQYSIISSRAYGSFIGINSEVDLCFSTHLAIKFWVKQIKYISASTSFSTYTLKGNKALRWILRKQNITTHEEAHLQMNWPEQKYSKVKEQGNTKMPPHSRLLRTTRSRSTHESKKILDKGWPWCFIIASSTESHYKGTC